MKKSISIFTCSLALTFLGFADDAKPACCAKEQPVEKKEKAQSDRSIYQVDSAWTNDAGKPVKLSQLQGKPQVITMFFASCEYACPILVHDMKKIEQALPEKLRSQLGFTLVSFDSDRDTPEVLRKYRQQNNLGAEWNLLRGGNDDVLEVAALLGVKFKKDARGQFSHSNIITVLNADGEIVHEQVGLNQSFEETAKVIESLLSKK